MSNARKIRIGERTVGPGHPTYIVAEIGINHNGDANLAHRMVDAAADSGADAVKFQTMDADASYAPGTPSHEVFSEAALDLEQYRGLEAHCDERGIDFFTTPGDWPSLEICRGLSITAIKISSGLMTNKPIVEAAARMGVPLVISTGGAYVWEIGKVVYELESMGKTDFVLLHCVSVYPAPDEILNLRAIESMREAFPYPIGYSDHSTGRVAPVSAVALGACLIEKHFTTDRNLPGGDNHMSAEPDEFALMVQEIRDLEKMLIGDGKRPHESEDGFRSRFRRRLVARVDIPAGEVLTRESVGLMRPLEPRGLAAEFFEDVLGRRTARDVRQHEPIDWDALTLGAERD
ncbi:MAG: N-acetylneuraminate synthase family protein [Chloroflexi bacterium]|nr:N-acetylneuraminate synthase family protein [Chloroflexota bacterium]